MPPKKERSLCWKIWCARPIRTLEVGQTGINVSIFVKELIVYVFFLTIVSLITMSMVSSKMFYFTNALTHLFLDTRFPNSEITYRESQTMQHFWTWIETVVLDSLYWEKWYNNEITNPEEKGVLYQNRLLGSPRLRQLRVRNDTCYIAKDFRKVIFSCYDVYSPHSEFKSTYGPENGTAWHYSTGNELNEMTYFGKLAIYGTGGYFVDMGNKKTQAQEIIRLLKAGKWTDRATRAIFLDFTVYNPSLNLFCIIRILTEFPATGGIVVTWNFRTAQLINYETAYDYLIFSCEILFCIFTFYNLADEVKDMFFLGKSYLKYIWNYVDLIILVISVLCIVFCIYRYVKIDQLLSGLLSSPTEYPNFQVLGFWQTQFQYVAAVAVFFSWIKIFKFISFNQTMMQLSNTLSRCSTDLLGFGVMFFIVFFAFAQLGYMIFGTQLKDFSTISQSIFTLLCIILGDFDFESLQLSHRILGPIFFVMYIFFVFFVLMNMFLAIISDTYSEVKSEIQADNRTSEVVEYIKMAFQKFLQRLTRKKRLLDMQSAVKDADVNKDEPLDYEEIVKAFKAKGLDEQDIESIFKVYDLDKSSKLDREEIQAMMTSWEKEEKMLDDAIRGDQHTNMARVMANRMKEKRSKLTEEVTILQTKVQKLTSNGVSLERRLKLLERRMATFQAEEKHFDSD